MPDARRPVPGSTEGHRNAWKHGLYSAAEVQRRRAVAELIRLSRHLVG
jgi:hypothetical protein